MRGTSSSGRFFLLLSVALFLAGCGGSGAGSSGGPAITIKLQLPASLAKDSNRYRRFQARASHLELVITSARGGGERRLTFPPGQWEALPVADLSFGDDARDVLTVKAQIWDSPGGQPRGYPVLAGKKQVAARDIEPGRATVVVVKLALQVRPQEFD